MNLIEREAYKWLPTIGEWYQVKDHPVWVLFAFEALGSLKQFYANLGQNYREDERDLMCLEPGTWIMITNITLGDFECVPAYLEFIIRNDQKPDPDEHSQKLYFLPMFPPRKFDPRNVSWTALLEQIGDREQESHVEST